VEGGEVDRALTKIRAEFNPYVGRIFEQVCREFLVDLMEKSTRVEWHNDKRKEYFALFSKAGFTPELKKENVILFDLKEIEKHMGRF
jgi:hypothetical protein